MGTKIIFSYSKYILFWIIFILIKFLKNFAHLTYIYICVYDIY